ncbi:hypothetical protein F5X96DRAFT_625734 [Biscogniauxia mediterranea]|nr:hypothetical protein F5X96DRAFT_625734 [Biscogniauxia mediterranea]
MNDQQPQTATASTQTSPPRETAAPLPQPTPSPTGPPNRPPRVPPAPPASSAAPPPSGPAVPPPGQQAVAPSNQPGLNQGNVPPAHMGGPNLIIVSPSQVPFLWYNCPIMAPSNTQGQTNQMAMAFPQATQNPNAPIHLGTSHFLTNPPPQAYAAQHAYVPQVATYTNITAPNGPVYVVRPATSSGNTGGPTIFYYM